MNRSFRLPPALRLFGLTVLVGVPALGCGSGTAPELGGGLDRTGVSEGEEAAAFTLSLHPSPLSIRAGQRDTVEVRIHRVPPFEAPVLLTVTGETKGVTALVDPATVYAGTARMVIELEDDAPLGDAGLTVRGDADGTDPDTVRLVLTTFGTPSGD